MWRPQLAALAGEFTVVAWDEPGAGRSLDVPADFTLPDYADCLAALIAALDLGPAHVAGLSWGGTVALELYRRRPELVATLVLADTYAGWKGSLPAAEVQARVAGFRQMLAVGEERFDPTLPGLFAGDPPADVVALMAAMAADVRPGSMRTALLVMAEVDQRDLLPRIAVPSLLIWGELDARSPLGVARQFEAAIPHAELVVIAGAGHISNLQRPDEFNAAVRAFCSRTRAAPIRAATAQDAVACTAIVDDLPDFFTDDVPDKVRSDLRDHGGWVVDVAGAVAGFVIVERRGTRAAEVLWAAVAAGRRGAGLGTRLVDHVLDELRADGVQIVEVKTLDASADYAPYDATRAFWLGRGFVQIDTIDPLPEWPPGNPAAILAVALAPTR